MKTSALGAACVMITTMTLLFLLAVVNMDMQTTSLRSSLSHALESSLSSAMNDNGSTLDSHQLQADVIEGISMDLKAHATLSVKVFQADASLGIIGVEATATYPSILAHAGRPVSVSVRRTVIRESTNTTAPGTVTITYEVTRAARSWTYKQYELTTGQPVPVPTDPPADIADTPFTGWSLTTADGRTAMSEHNIAAMRATSDLTFTADTTP